MTIYTGTGDTGETSLYSGQRVPKDHPHIRAVGAIDECNSTLGLSIALMPRESSLEPVLGQLIDIQHSLFAVGAALATPLDQATEKKKDATAFGPEPAAELEDWIDALTLELPPLKEFILPGGHAAGAALHQGRSICRQAERCMCPLVHEGSVNPEVLKYINRLSDYLFTAARWINHHLAVPEVKWQH